MHTTAWPEQVVYMAYNRIFDTSQLPRLGPLSEDLRFDMKMLLNKDIDEGNLACDVAAFANTAGGVLLVGAHEHPKDSGRLNAFVPVTFADAQSIGILLKKALDLCSPKPIAEAKPIELTPGKDEYVVAINCDAYAAPPIGVAQPNQGGGEKWWAFPTRRGRDTHNLRPEELATIMEPSLRRTMLLLDRMPNVQPENVRRATFYFRGGAERVTYDILSIDTESSSMRLRHTQERQEIVIPLGTVLMIWKNINNGTFCISIKGVISRIPVGLDFIP
jgi:hypothetical protein